MAEGYLVALFGTLLVSIVGLMSWQAIAIIGAGRSIAVLETLLKEIAEDVKKIGYHDAEIAVIKNEMGNTKSDIALLFEKVRELERNENHTLHRRQ